MKAPEASSSPTGFLGVAAAVYGVSFAGYLAARGGLATWYPGLLHPSFAPPPWVFGPAWSILYFLVSLAGWQLWRSPSSRLRTVAFGFFWAQLGVNALWCWLFFGLRLAALGAVVAGVLVALAAAACVLAGRTRPWAGALLVPFAVWAAFAGTLDLEIWSMNFRAGAPRIDVVPATAENR